MKDNPPIRAERANFTSGAGLKGRVLFMRMSPQLKISPRAVIMEAKQHTAKKERLQ